MCGRFSLAATEAEIREHFGVTQGFVMVSRYNIAPSQVVPVITSSGVLNFYNWGFIPRWAKTPDASSLPKPYINARAETLSEKPTFKYAYKSRRLIVPASGYFEWKAMSGKKQPFYITVPETKLLGFAGLWETWQPQDGAAYHGFTIITAAAPKPLSDIHARMPCILNQSHYENWLNPKAKESALVDVLSDCHQNFSFVPVSMQMNNPRFDHPSCLNSL